MRTQVVYTNYELVMTGSVDMAMTSTLMDKGLVVIPKELREQMGLKKGDKVIFVKIGNIVSLFPASKDPIREGRGMLRGGGTMADFLEEKRRELEEEERNLPPPLSER
jgi:AbrB family looped-hinge helix DNA binding protein